MNWQAKADKATAALRKFGAAVALVRIQQATPTNPWNPPAQTEASYQGKGLLLSYAAHLVDGTAIQALTDTPFDEFLTALAVDGDATWGAAPPTAFETVGLAESGNTEGSDIVVPAGGNLYGGDRFEIELTIR